MCVCVRLCVQVGQAPEFPGRSFSADHGSSKEEEEGELKGWD